MDERGARAPVDREGREPVHDRAGAEHHDAGAGDERRVELLARVELAELHVGAALAPEPARVVAGPAVQPAEVVAQAGARVQRDGEEHRERQREAAEDMDVAQELAVADQRGDRPRVQRRTREHEDDEEAAGTPASSSSPPPLLVPPPPGAATSRASTPRFTRLPPAKKLKKSARVMHS